jgi:hypothetical protein
VIVSFYRYTDYVKLKPTTRKVRRNMLERFRLQHGKKRVALLSAAHVKATIGDMAGTDQVKPTICSRPCVRSRWKQSIWD